MMGDDDNPSDAIPAGSSSLPPAAKISREVLHGIRDIVIPMMCLGAAKWGLVSGEIFAGAVFIVLGGNMALRRGEHGGNRR
jgi:hypothetical protein